MSRWFESLRTRVDKSEIHEATEEAAELSMKIPDICRQSSEFLSLASRICTHNRMWGYSQLLSYRALEVNNFEDVASRHWALTLYAFTAGCDLILRILPETPVKYRNQALDELPQIFEMFDSAVAMDVPGRELGREHKLNFLNLISSYMHFPPKTKELLLSHLSGLKDGQGVSHDYWIGGRVHQLNTLCEHEWVKQIDASEIGNESRYANHADYPNAVLVKRCVTHRESPCENAASCEWMPHVVALRGISEGDEITINYGSSYWTKIKPGIDPLLLGQVVSSPFNDCIYYDGVLTDFSCNPAPGGFLIPPFYHPKRLRRSTNLIVKRVPKYHPAYPGFGLFARTRFSVNEILCIYAGIVDMSPHSGRHASKYTVDLTGNPALGPFGFNLDPVTLVPFRHQRYLPFLTDFPDISLPLQEGEKDMLTHVDRIADLTEITTRTICQAVMAPGYRRAAQERLRSIPTPFDNPNKRDVQNWTRIVKKAFGDIFTKPPPPLIPHIVSHVIEPELVVSLDR